MVNDPYQVLGISPDASQDEIKRAYRKKAKEYHPDLHPDDPSAARKMNEVNEAYDMLTNPEKYASHRAQQRNDSQRSDYGNAQRQSQRQSYNGYWGAGGWSSDFGSFDFEDIFGFGATGPQAAAPTEMNGDSPAIRAAVQAINSRQYQYAVDCLSQIPSTGRNGRWYYLSSLANQGLRNEMQALEQIQRAIQMEPDNAMYRKTYQQIRSSAQSYQQAASQAGFNTDAVEVQRLCMSFCAAQFFCTFCRCI